MHFGMPPQSEKSSQPIIRLPLLPLKDIVIFPHMIVPVFINEEVCLTAVDAAIRQERKIFLSAFKSAPSLEPGLESKLESPYDVYNVGTVASVMRTRKLPDGRMKVLVQGIYKGEIQSLVPNGEGYPLVDIAPIRETEISAQDTSVEAVMRAVRESLEKVSSLGKVLSPDILMILEDVKEPGKLADLVASNLGFAVQDAQRVLAIQNPIERLAKVHTYLAREIEVFQMQVKIQNQAKEEIGKIQKEHYLREQIKALKTELGDHDAHEEVDILWKRASNTQLSEEAKEEVQRQLRRVERVHQDSSEASLLRSHVETILDLPWGVFTDDQVDLKKVADELDEDHFGLWKVKDRIMEYLAVKTLNANAKSPILCFAGPPGVGKTSLGRTIARAMGRKFERISLGGVRDEADIRGHRKTYVGAFPGRVITSLKNAHSSNPIIMLDEIDKLSSDFRGDPSAALLEVLDPEQNSHFIDHYLGIPFDLSKVMFIANANTLSNIPAPLRDRLEIVEISGYTEEEKLHILKDHIIPKQIKESGLSEYNLTFSKSALELIIRGYTRESGLRSTEKTVNAVCRKIARRIAEGKDMTEKDFRITPPRVKKYLGARIFGEDAFPFTQKIGLAFGMAYTPSGGEILPIETHLIPKGQGTVITGHLGEVMKESVHTALSFVKAHARLLQVNPELFSHHDIHIHFPHGAVSKDGPSAGVAIVTSFLSTFLQKNVVDKTCMTGEITLHGQVLAIGGLKEKLLAAQREGMNQAILPHQNKGVVEELDINLRKNFQIHYVDSYFEALTLLFGPEMAPAPQVSSSRSTSSLNL